MKKLAVLLVAIVAVFGVAKADDDRPIVVSKLPAKAQTFLKQYFKTSEVALAKEDRDLFSSTYDVIFTDGGKVEFEAGKHAVNIRNTETKVYELGQGAGDLGMICGGTVRVLFEPVNM